MEELSPEFLSTVAQVSATFMGFSMITSVFQALALGRSLVGEEYIKKKNFLVKLIALALFPIFVLSYPLILSLFLLSSNGNTSESCLPWNILVVNIFVLISYLYCFFSIQKYSELRGQKELYKSISFKLFTFLVTWVPIMLFLFAFISSVLPLFTKTFVLYPLKFILLVASGFILILRNLGIKIDKNVLFKSKDIEIDRFIQLLKKFENDINEAIKERENLVKKISERANQLDKEKYKELMKSVAEQRAEIRLFKEFIFKEFFEERVDPLRKKIEYEYITLRDFSDFESWRERANQVLWEFKRGTMRNQTVFDLIYGGVS